MDFTLQTRGKPIFTQFVLHSYYSKLSISVIKL